MATCWRVNGGYGLMSGRLRDLEVRVLQLFTPRVVTIERLIWQFQIPMARKALWHPAVPLPSPWRRVRPLTILPLILSRQMTKSRPCGSGRCQDSTLIGEALADSRTTININGNINNASGLPGILAQATDVTLNVTGAIDSSEQNFVSNHGLQIFGPGAQINIGEGGSVSTDSSNAHGISITGQAHGFSLNNDGEISGGGLFSWAIAIAETVLGGGANNSTDNVINNSGEITGGIAIAGQRIRLINESGGTIRSGGRRYAINEGALSGLLAECSRGEYEFG